MRRTGKSLSLPAIAITGCGGGGTTKREASALMRDLLIWRGKRNGDAGRPAGGRIDGGGVEVNARLAFDHLAATCPALARDGERRAGRLASRNCTRVEAQENAARQEF